MWCARTGGWLLGGQCSEDRGGGLGPLQQAGQRTPGTPGATTGTEVRLCRHHKEKGRSFQPEVW